MPWVNLETQSIASLPLFFAFRTLTAFIPFFAFIPFTAFTAFFSFWLFHFHLFNLRLHGNTKLIDFASRKQETTKSEIFEIGNNIISDRLTVFWLLARTLYISQKTVRMNRLINKCIPGFGNNRQILFLAYKSLINTPCHAINEKSGSGNLFPPEV